MSDQPRILAIIPAFNEAENLSGVIDELRSAEPTVDIVVVNDGSTDATGAIARSSGVALVELPVNSGMFCAVQAGLRFAYRHDYDIAIQFDADGQHDPTSIRDLVRPIASDGVDVVIGSRFLGHIQYRMSTVRAIGTRLFGWITSALARQRITDTTCGFRAYGSAAIRLFAAETSFEFRDATGLLMLARGGFRITEVATRLRPRIAGQSSIGALMTVIYPFHYLLSLTVVLLRQPVRKE